jgi:transaldolase
MTSIEQLKQIGQSIWLDNISRGLIRRGELKRLIEQDGLTGVSSNLAMFEKAVEESTDYDGAFDRLIEIETHIDAQAIYERMSIVDVRMAADQLRPVFDRTHGADGFASIEISPYLAHSTQASISEARRLWDRVHRPNLMVKIPATPEGIPAIEALLADGINVNVTLVFSLAHYDAVVGAYLRSIERAPDSARTASVVSISVSELDAAVDRELLRIGTTQALALRGNIAIAGARQIYRRFCGIFHSDRFAGLRLRGVHPQRLLWAGTATNSRTPSGVRYIEELIGPDTIVAAPPATLDSFRRQGQVRGITLHQNLAVSEATLSSLQSLGLDFDTVTAGMQSDGLATFAASLDKLLATLDCRRGARVTS